MKSRNQTQIGEEIDDGCLGRFVGKHHSPVSSFFIIYTLLTDFK